MPAGISPGQIEEEGILPAEISSVQPNGDEQGLLPGWSEGEGISPIDISSGKFNVDGQGISPADISIGGNRGQGILPANMSLGQTKEDSNLKTDGHGGKVRR